jgi:hypothetical protein
VRDAEASIADAALDSFHELIASRCAAAGAAGRQASDAPPPPAAAAASLRLLLPCLAPAASPAAAHVRVAFAAASAKRLDAKKAADGLQRIIDGLGAMGLSVFLHRITGGLGAMGLSVFLQRITGGLGAMGLPACPACLSVRHTQTDILTLAATHAGADPSSGSVCLAAEATGAWILLGALSEKHPAAPSWQFLQVRRGLSVCPPWHGTGLFMGAGCDVRPGLSRSCQLVTEDLVHDCNSCRQFLGAWVPAIAASQSTGVMRILCMAAKQGPIILFRMPCLDQVYYPIGPSD